MPGSLKAFLICWFIGFGVLFFRTRDLRIIKLLVVSVACILGVAWVGVALAFARDITPKYDLWLYQADWALGSPAFLASRLILPTWLYPVLVLVYESMPAVLLLVYAPHLLWRGTPERVLAGFALNFGIGYCLYFLLPACGPVYAFPNFPSLVAPLPRLHLLSISCNPNCMPSLHVSTALLALWFCWCWPAARAAALLHLGFTLLATLATGEHYLIDLVVAAPYAAFVYAAANWRIRAAAAWLALVLAWIASLRFGMRWITSAPVLLATACVVTVLIVLVIMPSPFLHRGNGNGMKEPR